MLCEKIKDMMTEFVLESKKSDNTGRAWLNAHRRWKKSLFDMHLKLSNWEEANCFSKEGKLAGG